MKTMLNLAMTRSSVSAIHRSFSLHLTACISMILLTFSFQYEALPKVTIDALVNEQSAIERAH